MTPAAGVEAYVADPVGHFCSGRTFVHFFLDRRLCGLLLWGTPDADDVRAMTGAIGCELPGRSPPHSSIVDARRLDGIDRAAFDLLAGYIGPRGTEFGKNVDRHALVRPGGVPGAVVAGFYDVAPNAHPDRTRVFTDPAAALAWLGRRDAAAVLAEIEALLAAASGTPALVRALRDHLGSRPRATLAQAAAALGVSARSLQDRLKRAGSSFRAELHAARVRAAQRLLAETEQKLTAIAVEVGFASLQHFSTRFRKATGMTPSAWRARARSP
jgi:AraC-like DNA-binding protein